MAHSFFQQFHLGLFRGDFIAEKFHSGVVRNFFPYLLGGEIVSGATPNRGVDAVAWVNTPITARKVIKRKKLFHTQSVFLFTNIANEYDI